MVEEKNFIEGTKEVQAEMAGRVQTELGLKWLSIGASDHWPLLELSKALCLHPRLLGLLHGKRYRQAVTGGKCPQPTPAPVQTDSISFYHILSISIWEMAVRVYNDIIGAHWVVFVL
jgi:hypothetical protein